jgi:hypothetical protein
MAKRKNTFRADLTPYERKSIKNHQWHGDERRKSYKTEFTPLARRYRDKMFFYQMLSLALLVTCLVLAWMAFFQNNSVEFG